jgi:PKD repeat protein
MAIDQFGCSSSSIQSIEVKALPVASFTSLPGQCDSTVTFTSTSVDTSDLISTYIWSFGDGTSDTLNAPNNSITHKFLSEGTFVVKLTVVNGNGCSDEESVNYLLNPCLLASFSRISQVECQNTLVSFNDLSVCQGVISEWEWTWGDESLPKVYTDFVPVITHMYSQTGVFKVSLKVTTIVDGSPYSVSTSQFVTILTAPDADFTYTGVCLGSRAKFYNSTGTSGISIDSYRWDFGDPTSDNDSSDVRDPYYTYPVTGEFETRLIVTNQFGCSDTATHTIQVNGLPTAGYTFSMACMGHPTQFFDHSDPNLAPLVYAGWVVSDGTQTIAQMTGANPAFTFDSLGVYTVLHIVSDSNNCSDTISYRVKVDPSPYSVFNINDNFENIQGQVKLENGSLGADEYYWELGNGETSYEESPLITYNEDGDYLIQLYAKNNFGCVDSMGVIYKMLFKGLWIPNAFSVGPIQSVRLWKPIGVNLAYYRVEVYDRWNTIIWHSDKLTEKGEPAEGWDGNYKDVPCKEGVYVWKITAIFSDGSIWRNNDIGNREGLSTGNSGTITLIR